MTLRQSIIFLSLIILISSCGGTKKTVKKKKKVEVLKNTFAIDFVSSDLLSHVLDFAKAENKPVYVDIHASWCLPCKLMEEEVYTDKPLAKFMNDNFINYRIDAEIGEGPEILEIFKVSVYPTLLFLGHRGRELARKDGSVFHQELYDLGEKALTKFEG